MNDNHWYPRNPQRWLTDTTWCDAATEVAHNRMTDTYYALGKPIKDEASRVQLIGKIRDTDYVRVKGCLMELGWSVENGEWRHKKCEETMQEMEIKRQEQIKRTSAASAAIQAKRSEHRNDDRNDDRNDLPNTTTTTITDTNTETAIQERECRALPEAAIPDWKEFKAYAEVQGIPEASARPCFDHYQSNNLWLNQHGRAIDWKQKLAAWVVRARSKPTQSRQDGAQRVQDNQEYQRCSERMKTLRSTYGDHQTWSVQDKAEFAKLRARKLELKTKLGITI